MTNERTRAIEQQLKLLKTAFNLNEASQALGRTHTAALKRAILSLQGKVVAAQLEAQS